MAARAKASDPIAALAAQLQALQDQLADLQPGSPENPRKKSTRGTRKAPVGKRQPASRKARTLPDTCITAGMAHVMLGGDEEFTPRDPDKPATAKQLWVLNSRGMLTPA